MPNIKPIKLSEPFRYEEMHPYYLSKTYKLSIKEKLLKNDVEKPNNTFADNIRQMFRKLQKRFFTAGTKS